MLLRVKPSFPFACAVHCDVDISLVAYTLRIIGLFLTLCQFHNSLEVEVRYMYMCIRLYILTQYSGTFTDIYPQGQSMAILAMYGPLLGDLSSFGVSFIG